MSIDSSNPLTLFISYASVDRARVLEMVAALDRSGIQTWIDLEGIAAGESYGPEIVNGMRNAHAVLLMCTNASLASRDVRQEIQLVWRYDRPIIPVLLEQLAM
ncbi:MAG: toll/interleukin-1 receptor domain-containing protein [Chloroflexota bacterium]|nr:toll/interleukin-1 receptor domain-containing protein [Chloroflexota bacterium]